MIEKSQFRRNLEELLKAGPAGAEAIAQLLEMMNDRIAKLEGAAQAAAKFFPVILLLLALPAFAGEDSYFDMAFPDLVKSPPDAHLHPHVCVVGTVAQRPRREKDGDTHLKLCQGSLCLTLEAIPEVPILLPRKGQRIRACGIQRWDGWHRWQEIHPLLSWKEKP